MARMMMGNRVRGLSCDIFQADLTKMEWMEVENLGDRILFLSHGNSVSICASEMGCKGNRVYFIPYDVERLAECSCCHPGGIYLKSCGKNVPYV